jgi:hypothetical protein
MEDKQRKIRSTKITKTGGWHKGKEKEFKERKKEEELVQKQGGMKGEGDKTPFCLE